MSELYAQAEAKQGNLESVFFELTTGTTDAARMTIN